MEPKNNAPQEQNTSARTSLTATIEGIQKRATAAEQAAETNAKALSAFIEPLAQRAGHWLSEAADDLPGKTKYLLLGAGLMWLFTRRK